MENRRQAVQQGLANQQTNAMILVTGATGRIGRAVVHSLIAEHDINPRVLVRDRGAAEAVLPERGRILRG